MTEIKEQPPAGEFTKEVRLNVGNWEESILRKTQDIRVVEIIKWLKVACDRLDASEAENKALRRPLEAANFKVDGMLAVGNELIKKDLRIQRLEASRKDLLDAFKRYGHHDSPCAGILDLNEDSECTCGFEAAIAKAKK